MSAYLLLRPLKPAHRNESAMGTGQLGSRWMFSRLSCPTRSDKSCVSSASEPLSSSSSSPSSVVCLATSHRTRDSNPSVPGVRRGTDLRSLSSLPKNVRAPIPQYVCPAVTFREKSRVWKRRGHSTYSVTRKRRPRRYHHRMSDTSLSPCWSERSERGFSPDRPR